VLQASWLLKPAPLQTFIQCSVLADVSNIRGELVARYAVENRGRTSTAGLIAEKNRSHSGIIVVSFEPIDVGFFPDDKRP